TAIDMAVGDEGTERLRRQAFEQPVAYERLAHAHIAGEQPQAFVVGQGLQEAVESLLVRGGGIIGLVVRRRSKRTSAEPKVSFVHRQPSPPEAGRSPCRSHRLSGG